MDYGGDRFSQAIGLDERWTMKDIGLIADIQYRLKSAKYSSTDNKCRRWVFIPLGFIKRGLFPLGSVYTSKLPI